MKIENYKKINKAIILYDSKCILCNRYIHFIIKNDINEIFYFTSIYNNTGKKIINDYKINTNLDDTIIFAPSYANLKAIPFPNPLQEPVMIDTLLFKSKKLPIS